MRVSVADGKYEVILSPDNLFYATRHGIVWRDCTGDEMIFSLAYELNEARKRLQELEYRIESLEH